MKKLILVLTIMLISANSFACRYYIDQKAVSAQLEAIAIANIKGGSENVKIIRTSHSNFAFRESISTPMCPEELTYTLDVDIAFSEKTPTTREYCQGIIKVTKIESWTGGDDQYILKGKNRINCTR